MPNWVANHLSIGGPAEDIADMIEQVGRPFTVQYTKPEVIEYNDPVFAFWNIVAPEDLEAYADGGIGTNRNGWYSWNTRHWGTKWDVAGNVEFTQYDEQHVLYEFDTAWGPPVEALINLSTQYPDIEFELAWQEEQGYGGTIVFSNGEAEETDSYDIPETHEEQTERFGFCFCESDDEQWFSDCPVQGPEKG